MNEEELSEQSRVLKQVLMQIAIRLQQPYRPVSLPEHLAQVEKVIQETIDFVQTKVRPLYDQKSYFLAEGARQNRGFEKEYSRLKEMVLDLFVVAWSEQFPELGRLLDEPRFQTTRVELLGALRALAEREIVPILSKMPKAGDDLYLQLSSWVHYAPAEDKIQSILDTGIASPESPLASYGMLGLLIAARKAYDGGEVEQAYSYLLDLSHFIGMRDGAHSITSVLPELSKKLHQVRQSYKSREKKHADATIAARFFCDLRPKNERGLRKPWPTAIAAAEEIWDVLVNEVYKGGEPELRFSGLKKYCERWVKDEENGGTLGLDIHWVRVPPADEDLLSS